VAVRKSKGKIKIIEAVDAHVEEHIGKIAFVLDEIDSPLVHVDVYVVAATHDRPYHTLVTSGMSEKAMPVPNGALDGRFAELAICLPPNWPLTMEAWKDEANWWPIKLLKRLARYPHENKTWMYSGHSVVWSNPPKPFAENTRMTAVVLLRPRLIPEENQIIHVTKNKHIRLWGVFPIYQEELVLKVRDGSDKLDELFDQCGVTELLDPNRKSVAAVM
jgi:Suppressor of fused protein (SUFU)